MDNNIRKQLQKWHDNNLISQETFNEIVKFENNSIPAQKSKVARAITLIGSLFVLSGLLGTLPLIWMNLAYWAQLLLLITITGFLFYAASYSEKFENKFRFIFKSSERVSSILFLISTISFGAVIAFTLNIINQTNILNINDDIAIIIVAFSVFGYAGYLYQRTEMIFQHIVFFYSLIFLLGSIGNTIFSNIEPWAGGLFLISVGFIWGLYTYSNTLKPSWLGYFLSSTTISIGTILLVTDLIRDNILLELVLLILGSLILVWASIQLSEQVIFFIGGLGLVVNLGILINELFPDDIWPPLIYLLVGGVLVSVGLYLNSLRENLLSSDD